MPYFQDYVSTRGPISGQSLQIADGPHSVDNIDVTTQLWLATAMKQQVPYRHAQSALANGATLTQFLGRAGGDGEVIRAHVVVTARPSTDRSMTVKIQRVRAGSAVDVTNNYSVTNAAPASDATTVAFTIDSNYDDVEEGDYFQAVYVQAAGTGGTYPLGVGVDMVTRENPDP